MSVAIAAPHTAALDAARAAGGNALDRALAMATTLAVVYPHQNALGGDLIALVRDPDGTVRAVLSAGAAPRGVDVGAIRAANDRMPAQGPHPVTVPGIAAGWDALAGLGATVPLADHLRAAAQLAEDGVPVAKDLARALVEPRRRDRHRPRAGGRLRRPARRATRSCSPSSPRRCAPSPTRASARSTAARSARRSPASSPRSAPR